MKKEVLSKFIKQKQALLQGDKATVKAIAEDARKEFLAKGYVNADPTFHWILKDWLDKALREGILIRTAKGYFPLASKSEEIKITGYKGRTPIEEKKLTVNYKKFSDFCKQYDEHLEAKGGSNDSQ